MDVTDVLRQGQRVQRAIGMARDRFDLDTVRERHLPGELVDLTVRRPGGGEVRLMHLKALVDSQQVQSEIVGPLAETPASLQALLAGATAVTSAASADQELLNGAVLFVAQGRVLALPMAQFPTRSVQEPSTERAVFSPKDALVEDLEQNVGLIRSHLRDPRLRVEHLTLGEQARSTVAVCHVAGVADVDLVDDAVQRLHSYRPVRVGFVSALLRPLFGPVWDGFLDADFTERPYRVADFLARGRLAILVDGSPFALVTPITFVEIFIDEEEYLQATTTRFFVRALRILSFFLALLMPGLYVALLTVNPTILPGLLAIAVASSRQSLPFPVVTEIILLLLILDIMAEATVSMKGLLGPTISIVGALIAGQAAIRANLASDLGVIVASVTLLATFMTSRYQLTYSVRVWKYPILLLSAAFGILGWATGILWLMANFVRKRRFGVSYLAPIAPLRPQSVRTTSHHGRQAPPAPAYIRRAEPES